MKRLLLWLLALAALTGGAQARTTRPLDDGWSFFFVHENSGDRARSVSLPHTWNFDALAGVYPYQRTQAVYTRSLYIPADWSGKRLFLRFAGVENTADLFVNGNHAGNHVGAGVAFTFEITDCIRFGADNQLLVLVANTPRSDLMSAADRNLYGGIVRGVELLVTDPVAVSPLYLGTEGLLIHAADISDERVEGYAELHLSIPSPRTVDVTLRAYDPQNRLLFRQHRTLKSSYDRSKPLSIPFSILQPQLWSPDRPALYRFEAEVSTEDSSDRVEVTTGLRRVELTPQGLFLNGERIDLRGVSLAYDRPDVATLWGDSEAAADLELVRDLGANALCSPAAPHPGVLYDRCDREGMLVRIDLPFIRTPFLSDMSYFASETFEQNGERLLQEIVAQHINHPSVVLWGLFSDLRGVDKHLTDYVGRLNRAARAIDPSRPTVVTSCENGPLNFLSDGVIWRQQAGWNRGLVEDLGIWLEKLAGEWSHLASAVRYGFEGFVEQQPDEYGRPTPGTLELPERRQTHFHEEYASRLAADSLLWGWWIDGLSDYGSARRGGGRNGSGLVSFDRKTRKDAFYLYRALWNRREPTLHLTEKRWTDRPAAPQRLTVYASEGLEPVLTVNGDTVALERYAPAIYRTAEIELGRENEAVVTAGPLRDRALIRCGSDLKRPVPTDLLQTINRLPRD